MSGSPATTAFKEAYLGVRLATENGTSWKASARSFLQTSDRWLGLEDPRQDQHTLEEVKGLAERAYRRVSVGGLGARPASATEIRWLLRRTYWRSLTMPLGEPNRRAWGGEAHELLSGAHVENGYHHLHVVRRDGSDFWVAGLGYAYTPDRMEDAACRLNLHEELVFPATGVGEGPFGSERRFRFVDPVDEAIVRHYENVREEERLAKGLGQLELLRTQEVLRRHLPDPPADVLDVGGATGIHAAWLARGGYRVRLIDIVSRHVEKANTELGGLGITAEIGDARRLAAPDEVYDLVLMLGPLYHMPDREDRIRALREAARVARPGGVVAVAAVSRFASLFDGLARDYLFDPRFAEMAARDLSDGQHRNPEDHPHWWTTAFLHRPEELRAEVIEAGLRIRELVGLEGLAGYLSHLTPRLEHIRDRDSILWSARVVESEPSLMGLSAHMLLIAEAPA